MVNSVDRAERARIKLMLVDMESLGHRTMLGNLRQIFSEMPLSPDQARAVLAEIEWRKDRVETLQAWRTSIAKTAQYERFERMRELSKSVIIGREGS